MLELDLMYLHSAQQHIAQEYRQCQRPAVFGSVKMRPISESNRMFRRWAGSFKTRWIAGLASWTVFSVGRSGHQAAFQ